MPVQQGGVPLEAPERLGACPRKMSVASWAGLGWPGLGWPGLGWPGLAWPAQFFRMVSRRVALRCLALPYRDRCDPESSSAAVQTSRTDPSATRASASVERRRPCHAIRPDGRGRRRACLHGGRTRPALDKGHLAVCLPRKHRDEKGRTHDQKPAKRPLSGVHIIHRLQHQRDNA